MNYIDKAIVETVIGSAKGRFMAMSVNKKCGEPRRFVFKVCPERPPSYAKHPHLLAIRETNGSYRSFDVNRVTRMKAGGTEIEAVQELEKVLNEA